MSAALVSVFAALVSVYIVDAPFLDAASAAVAVAVEAAEAGAAELAGYASAMYTDTSAANTDTSAADTC